MRGIHICVVLLLLGVGTIVQAGEFPDSWTWDKDAKARDRHAALEGKPMPALDLTGWMNGEVKPKTVIARRPMIYGLDRGRHQKGPMAELIGRGEALENSGEALVVSICAGFSRANIRDVGPSVTVTVDMARGDARPHGQAIAEEFMDHAWATRDYQSFTLLSVAEAVAGCTALGRLESWSAACARIWRRYPP